MNHLTIDIDFDESETAALLIPAQTGLTYCRQTGGHRCYQDSIEGVYVPVNPYVPSEGKGAYLANLLCGHFSSGWLEINDEVADELDEILSSSRVTKCMSVDRKRLDWSHESWVYVNVSSDDCFLFPYAEEGFRAILTWPNSD